MPRNRIGVWFIGAKGGVASTLLKDVASAAGVHPAHLNRVFRAHYQRSVGEYLSSVSLTRIATSFRSR